MPPRTARTFTLLAITTLSLLAGCAQTGGPRKTEAIRGLEGNSPDIRRQSINELVRGGPEHSQRLLTRFAEIARHDRDELVRATAIRALNRARDASATQIFIDALNDKSVVVRLEAAKALANLPDERAVVKLTQLVNSETEDKDVRIAAADALKHYRSVDGARALIAQLDNRDFGVAWQSRRSLVRLTGKDLRYDEAAWLAFIASPDRPFG